MVRTRANNSGKKAVAAKAPRKALGRSSTPSASLAASPAPGGSKYAGGNAVCSRPIPEWQKGIAGFLVKSPETGKENDKPGYSEAGAGCSQSPGPSSSDGVLKNGLVDSDNDDE